MSKFSEGKMVTHLPSFGPIQHLIGHSNTFSSDCAFSDHMFNKYGIRYDEDRYNIEKNNAFIAMVQADRDSGMIASELKKKYNRSLDWIYKHTVGKDRRFNNE